MSDAATREALFATLRRVDATQAAALWPAPAPGARLWTAAFGDHGSTVAALQLDADEISFVVAPDVRGRGVGRQLLAAWLASCAPGPLRARASRENLASRRTLAGAGFVEAGLQQVGTDRSPLVLYRRHLDRAWRDRP